MSIGRGARLAAALALCLLVLLLLGIGAGVDFAAIIHKYQTLIGTLLGIGTTGTLGFWSVTKTLRGNAENLQKQKEREIEHERRGVIAALRAELKVLYSAVKQTHHVQIKTAETMGDTALPVHLERELSRVF